MHVWVCRILVRQITHLCLSFAFDDNLDRRRCPILHAQLSISTLFYFTLYPYLMVNPGTFKGLRKQFLDSQQDVYAAAIKGKHVADTVADIQHCYFK